MYIAKKAIYDIYLMQRNIYKIFIKVDLYFEKRNILIDTYYLKNYE